MTTVSKFCFVILLSAMASLTVAQTYPRQEEASVEQPNRFRAAEQRFAEPIDLQIEQQVPARSSTGNAPSAQHAAAGATNEPNAKEMAEIRKLQQQIRQFEGDDKTKREAMVEQLRTLMQDVFNDDYNRRESSVVQLEERVNRLRAALDKRKAARDRIISNRIDALLLEADGLTFPANAALANNEPSYEILSVEKNRDGSSTALVLILTTRPERYRVLIPETRSRTSSPGERPEAYTVMVPQTRIRFVPYSIRVPIPVPKGKQPEELVEQYVRDYKTKRPAPANGNTATSRTPNNFDVAEEEDDLHFNHTDAEEDNPFGTDPDEDEDDFDPFG